MKKMITLFALTTAVTAHAGDTSSVYFLGFSPDGNSVGFEEYGTYESNESYCKVSLIDTRKNDFIVPPSFATVPDAVDAFQACASARTKVAKTLAALKLDPRRGTRTFSRVITDAAVKDIVPANRISFSHYPHPLTGFSDLVTLTEIGTGKKDVNELETQMFKLEVSDETRSFVLQEDRKLPASRGEPYTYQLEEGYVFDGFKKTAYAFTVRYFTAGFEGPDGRALFVTGIRDR